RPSSPEVFASPRRRALVSPLFPMTCAPAEPRATFNWQRRSWLMSKPPEARKALGKGLSALLPQRPAPDVPASSQAQTPPPDQRGTVREVSIADIDPNP